MSSFDNVIFYTKKWVIYRSGEKGCISTVCPKSLDPFVLLSKSYKLGHVFLGIQYTEECPLFIDISGCDIK